MTQEKLERIRTMLSEQQEDEKVIVKMISNGEVPLVEIFTRRFQPDNALVSINNTVALDNVLNK